MYGRGGGGPYQRQIRIGGFDGPPPRDILMLLGVVFATYSLQFLIPALVAPFRLTELAWQSGLLWQLASYPWFGWSGGGPSVWILLELLILYWFAGDVYVRLGRRRFWRLFVGVTIAAGTAAVLVDIVTSLMGARSPSVFTLLQGQRSLILVAIAAFGTLRQNATILLFFILPIQARWFLPLEIVIGFIGFLGTRDLPGFVGICVLVGLTWLLLRAGGPGRALREARLRLEKKYIEMKLGRRRRKSGLRVVRDDDEGSKPPWIN